MFLILFESVLRENSRKKRACPHYRDKLLKKYNGLARIYSEFLFEPATHYL